jgi:hypothetical protein
MRTRAELQFTGAAGLAVGRALVEELKSNLDSLERWKNGDPAGYKDDSCSVIVTLPDGVTLTLVVKT